MEEASATAIGRMPRSASELFGGGMMSPMRDVHCVYARLRREHPAECIKSEGAETWLITRYDDVNRILSDAQTFSSAANARGIGLVMGRTLIEMDGAEHLRQRRLVTPSFSPRAVRERATSVIDEAIDTLIDDFVRDGQADLVSQFTFTFPIRVIANLIGVPIEDFHQFHTWALQLLSVHDDPNAGFAAARHIVEHLKPVIEERRRKPCGDLLSTLASAEIEDEKLVEEEILSFLRLLLPAGAETTYRFTGTILHALLTHSDARQAVQRDSDRLDDVLEEALRWEAPVQFVSRETTCTVEIGGRSIPAGAMLMTAIGSANRDESRFANPDCFDIDRPNNHEHLAFGFGAHYCLGTHLARQEARRAVARLLARLPNLRLAPEAQSNIVGVAFRSPDQLPVVFDT
ncbi:MAG: cytochrome P450 [Deltaproteobacteria bacterium]